MAARKDHARASCFIRSHFALLHCDREFGENFVNAHAVLCKIPCLDPK